MNPPARDAASPLARDAPSPLVEHAGDPPVVARLIVEIRSDGSRTIARGAMEDVATGERVSVEARGTTPVALAASLTRSLLAMPVLARHAVKSLLASRRRP